MDRERCKLSLHGDASSLPLLSNFLWTSALRGLPLRGDAASLPLLRARWLRAAPPALLIDNEWIRTFIRTAVAAAAAATAVAAATVAAAAAATAAAIAAGSA